MANISLLQTLLSTWPVRTGAVAFGATTTDGLSLKYSDSSSRQVSLRMDVTTSVPVAAGTTIFNDDDFNQLLNLDGAALIASHTVTLPTNANSSIGQEVVISTLFEITALTINGASTIRGYSAPFLLAAGTSKRLVKIASDTWAII